MAITIDLASKESDVDWARAARLSQKAKAGDKEAHRELAKMEMQNAKEHKADITPLPEGEEVVE